MDLIPIQISYDGKWTKNEQGVWLHDDSKMKATYIRKGSTLRDLKDAVFEALDLDPMQYELRNLKFFFAFNIPNQPPCPCTTDRDVAIFIDKQLTNLAMHTSPLYVDIVPRVVVPPVPQFRSLHRARTIHARFSSGSGSNHIPLSNPARGHNGRERVLSPSTVGASATPALIPELQRTVPDPEAVVTETQVPETQLNEGPENIFYNERVHDDNERWAFDDVPDILDDDIDSHDRHRDDGDLRLFDDDVDAFPYGNTPDVDDDVHDVMHGNTPEGVCDMGDDMGDARHAPRGEPVENEGNIISEPEPYAPYVPPISYPDVSSSRFHCQTFEIDQMFASKQDLKKKLSLHAIKNNYQFRVKKSDTGRFDVGCIDENCTWKLRATPMSGSLLWSIKVYVPHHTCNLNNMHRDHRQASSSVIGELFRSKFTTTGRQFKPKDLIDDVRRELGANMSYDKAWRARECARGSVYGTPEESYAKLPLWSAILESKNSGSITRIETDSENRFQYYFMAIGASIRGFQHMRPVVAVDGTFLKNRYGGILYIATCLDGNEQIYPLAFGIGPTENDASYLWFFSRFKEAYGDRLDLVFITDRHPSFVSAIRSVYPNVYHGYCAYHLLQNMKAKHSKIDRGIWKSIKSYFYGASRAYLTEDFDLHMGQLRELSSECYQYLMEANPSKWARSHFPGNRFSIMTTNIAESMNSLLKDAREEPIIPLLNRIRDVLQRWFYERRNSAADQTTSPVTKELDKILNKRKDASSSYYVVAANLYEFEVHGGELIGLVNLRTRTCSCRELTLDGYPCVHAFAVCKERNMSPYSLCDPYYSVEVLRQAYSETIHPLGDPKQWHAPVEVLDRVVHPPIFTRRAGRRRINRILSQGEDRLVKKCGRCKRSGHNRKTCTFPVALESTVDRQQH